MQIWSVKRKQEKGNSLSEGYMLELWDFTWINAPWMILDEILCRYGDFDWVSLLRIRGAVGYASLHEIHEENIRANQWERKFQDARVREDALKRELLGSQDEKVGLEAQIVKSKRSLHQHCSLNSVTELKASQAK
ncbi:hypothetical protein Gorai_014555, partial [Gossypium raimondii]|nr:hypothetical protein [Gossypium raimondii]